MTSLIISDLHAPYHHPGAIDFLADTARAWRIDDAYAVGDLWDHHRVSRHKPQAEALGPKQELEEARRFNAELGKLFPKLRICHGNHDFERVRKVANDAGIPGAMLKSWRALLQAPAGWRLAEHFRAGGYVVFHGNGYAGQSAGLNAINDWGSSVAFGHLHAELMVRWHRRAGGLNWSLQVGCLIDPAAPAFAYGKEHRRKPVLGCGVVAEGIPFAVPFRE